MFSGFMTNAWIIGSLVAVVAGVVGFFVVLRGTAFPAHAIPNGAFAGAAGANLIGLSPLLGLGVFSVAAALGISALGRRSRPDVATALALVMMLALGAAFLSQSTAYEPQIYALLFGEILGVGSAEILPVTILSVLCVLAIGVLYRRLMLSSLSAEIAATRGINPHVTDTMFLLVVAGATTMTVPVVGALLIFSLLIGPSAAARSLTDRAGVALAGSVGLALVTIWMSLALAYSWNWPVGFFVGTLSALWFAAARLLVRVRRRVQRRAASDHADARTTIRAVVD